MSGTLAVMLGKHDGAVFSFHDRWWLPAPPDAVRDVLVDLESYPLWWPQVVAVASLGPDDARALCRSTLPYTLDLVLHAVSRELPVLEVAVAGHLSGWVRWRLAAERGGTGLHLAQQVTVHGPLAPLAAGLRPLARWNHRRMLAGGLAGLRAHLAK
ncbi:SRPBCC family protein, partial [Nocardioides sp. CER28]